VAAFNSLERSPVVPALSAQDLPRGQTKALNLCRIKRIDCHAAESDEDSAAEIISDTCNWLDWNGDMDDPNASEDDWQVKNESDIELDNGIYLPETPVQHNVSATLNVPRLIAPTRMSNTKDDKVLMTVKTMAIRKNQENRKCTAECVNAFSACSLCFLTKIFI